MTIGWTRLPKPSTISAGQSSAVSRRASGQRRGEAQLKAEAEPGYENPLIKRYQEVTAELDGTARCNFCGGLIVRTLYIDELDYGRVHTECFYRRQAGERSPLEPAPKPGGPTTLRIGTPIRPLPARRYTW